MASDSSHQLPFSADGENPEQLKTRLLAESLERDKRIAELELQAYRAQLAREVERESIRDQKAKLKSQLLEMKLQTKKNAFGQLLQRVPGECDSIIVRGRRKCRAKATHSHQGVRYCSRHWNRN